MRNAFTAAVALVALGLGATAASAQYPTLVPHRGHYDVVPSYSPRVYGGYGYKSYSPFGYSSRGLSFGGYSSGFGYGSRFSSPGFGYGSQYHHHHHNHHHHGHW
jgi:hypothetical protein